MTISVEGTAGGGDTNANQCPNGCGFTLTDTVDVGPNGNCSIHVDGTRTCYFKGVGTGAHCSTNASGSPVSAPKSTGTETATTTTAAGTTQVTQTTTVNPDGTTTTTTTTTTTPAGGGTPTTSTSTTTTSKTGTATGSGSGSGNGSGTGSGSSGDGSGPEGGSGECDPTAADYLICLLGEPGEMPEHPQATATTFGEALTTFTDGLKQTPIARLGGSMANIVPEGGTCPTPSFSILGETFEINMHCTLYAQVAGLLSGLMLAVWSIIGIRIIISA